MLRFWSQTTRFKYFIYFVTIMFSKKDIERARKHASEEGKALYHVKTIDMNLGSRLVGKAKKYKGFKID